MIRTNRVIMQSSTDSGVERIIDTAQASIEDALVTVADLLPKVLLAVVVFAAAVFIIRRIERYITQATAYVENSITTDITGEMFPNVRTEKVVGRAVSAFIILYAAFIASRIVGFREVTTELNRIVFYLPDLLAGIAIILLSVGVGRLASERTLNGGLAAETEYEVEIAIGVKAIIVAVGSLVGLEMVGVDLQLVYILAEGFAGGIGIGLTAALAIVIGLIAGTTLRDSGFFSQQD